MTRNFSIRKAGIFCALLFIFGIFHACRKSAPKEPEQAKALLLNAPSASAINLWEIYQALPKTIAYNLGKELKFDVNRAQWIYRKDGLLVRIPLTKDEYNWIYMAQPYNNPEQKRVYMVRFYLDAGSTATSFNGKQIWIDLQDWHLYGISYQDNKVAAFMQPVKLAEPGWENCMLENGDLYLASNDKIAFRDEEPQSGAGLRSTGPDDGCGGLIGPERKSLWNALGDFFSGIIGGMSNTNGSGDGWPGFGNAGPPNWIPGGIHDWGGNRGGGGPGPTPEEEENTITPQPPHSAGDIFATTDHPGDMAIPTWLTEGPLEGVNQVYLVENPTIGFLSGMLTLNQQQRDWLLLHPDKANRMKSYLLLYIPALTQDQKKDIMREHLLKMMTDAGYYNFISNYDQNNAGMWWTNENWLDNPVNDFQLCPNQAYDQFQHLTTDEKALVGLYPVQAYVISGNVNFAGDVSENTGLPQAHNGKQDAFRHAFFQAINTRDVPARLPATASQIVHLFAAAHESETPAALQLEKEMDLFNNEVGIDYCWNCFMGITFNNTIRDAIISKLNNGDLRYLKSLDANDNIIPGTTYISPTNQ